MLLNNSHRKSIPLDGIASKGNKKNIRSSKIMTTINDNDDRMCSNHHKKNSPLMKTSHRSSITIRNATNFYQFLGQSNLTFQHVFITLLLALSISYQYDQAKNSVQAQYFINRPTPLQTIVPLNAPPGTVVYKLQARSDSAQSLRGIRYQIVSDMAGGRFEVDERSGEVRTRGTEPFTPTHEYTLIVRADELGRLGYDHRSDQQVTLSIIARRRKPQFYLPHYSTTIREDTKKDSEIMEIKAKSFADREIKYTLQSKTGKTSGAFVIDSMSGKIRLAKDLDYEDMRQPKSYVLQVNASEDSGGLTSSTDVTIGITDVNDNAPRFELPDYAVYGVLEDVKIGTKITTVSAQDSDSGKNAQIEYSVDRPEFSIDSAGNIMTSRRLDADVNNHYVLTVKATDKGNPPLSGTAVVRVYTENTNDEAPKFSQDVYTPNVDETAKAKTLVTTVVASDKDGDNVIFGFAPGTKNSLFHIVGIRYLNLETTNTFERWNTSINGLYSDTDESSIFTLSVEDLVGSDFARFFIDDEFSTLLVQLLDYGISDLAIVAFIIVGCLDSCNRCHERQTLFDGWIIIGALIKSGLMIVDIGDENYNQGSACMDDIVSFTLTTFTIISCSYIELIFVLIEFDDII